MGIALMPWRHANKMVSNEMATLFILQSHQPQAESIEHRLFVVHLAHSTLFTSLAF